MLPCCTCLRASKGSVELVLAVRSTCKQRRDVVLAENDVCQASIRYSSGTHHRHAVAHRREQLCAVQQQVAAAVGRP